MPDIITDDKFEEKVEAELARMPRLYISSRGLEELKTIRVNANGLRITGGRPPAELLAALPSEDCGCPEELWLLNGVMWLIHFEADGTGEVTVFDDEYGEGTQHQVPASTIDELRAQMFLLNGGG